MYTYIVAKVKYISKTHADNEDHEEEDDEIVMTSHIQKICFVTNNLKTVVEKVKDYPFDDPIEFDITENELHRYFDQSRRYLKDDDMDPIYQEIGIYYKHHIAQYFICLIQVPTL